MLSGALLLFKGVLPQSSGMWLCRSVMPSWESLLNTRVCLCVLPGLPLSPLTGVIRVPQISWELGQLCLAVWCCLLQIPFCELSYTAAIRPTETCWFLSICRFPGIESADEGLPTHQLSLFRSSCPYFFFKPYSHFVDPEGNSVF